MKINHLRNLHHLAVAFVFWILTLQTPAVAQTITLPATPVLQPYSSSLPLPSAQSAEPLFPSRNATASPRDGRSGPFHGMFQSEPRSRPGPDVPEPMVFDLIRPLGVRRGEFEVNVLAFVPLRRTRSRTPQFSFITGADQSTMKRPAFEWAPEVEYGVSDNFAVEFELPLAEGQVEAFKGAAQYTLGTAFNDHFIHGFQGILFIDRSNGAVSPTFLYLTAVRFDPTYSFLGMVGFSHEFGGDNPRNPTQILINTTLFAELSKRHTLGLEANYTSELDGAASLLFMPQVHWNPSENFSLQFGVGTRAQEGNLTGEVVFRVIRQF